MHWKVIDAQGLEHPVLAPRRLVHKPADLRALLMDHLAALPTDASQALAVVNRAIAKGPARANGKLTSRTGWYPATSPTAFVLPGRTIGDTSVMHRARFKDSGLTTAGAACGSLKGWRKGLTVPCRSSAYLIFGISLALAGPTLLYYPSRTGLLFNLAGETGTGKTLILRAMQSAMKRAADNDLTSMELTAPGLEMQALEHNDLFMCLDEFGAALSTPKLAASLINRLAYITREGRGKTRSRLGQKAMGYDHANWATAVMTSSERSLEQLMGDEKREAGAQMRYVDIPVPNRNAFGAFPPVQVDGKEKSITTKKLLKLTGRAITENYGWALPAFIQALLTDTSNASKICRYMKEFSSALHDRNPAQQQRYSEGFAKVYAAGRLAAELGIAPFDVEQVTNAVILLFDRSALVQTDSLAQRDLAIAALKTLGADAARCPVAQKGKPIDNSAGNVIAARIMRQNKDYLFLMPDGWKAIIPAPVRRDALTFLRQADILHAGPNALTKQVKIMGLDPAQPKPSGYLFDWQKLASLPASSVQSTASSHIQ